MQGKHKIKTKTNKNMTTYGRLTQDPKRKAKIEREYHDLLLSELRIALMMVLKGLDTTQSVGRYKLDN